MTNSYCICRGTESCMKIACHGSAYRRAATTSNWIHQWIVLIKFPCLMINNNNNITHRYFWLKTLKFPKVILVSILENCHFINLRILTCNILEILLCFYSPLEIFLEWMEAPIST